MSPGTQYDVAGGKLFPIVLWVERNVFMSYASELSLNLIISFVADFSNKTGTQRLINLEIPVLVRSMKSSNVELGYFLDGETHPRTD